MFDSIHTAVLDAAPASSDAVNGTAATREVETPAAGFPADLIFSEWAVAVVRRALRARGLEDYQIFYCADASDLYDIDEFADSLGGDPWQPLPAASGTGEPLRTLTCNRLMAKAWESGCRYFPERRVMVVRWYWIETADEGFCRVYFYAAPSAEHYRLLREEVLKLRRARSARFWQVVTGSSYRDGPRTPRSRTSESLVLPAELRRRIECEIIRFFSPETGELYRALEVPYRRGVLFHGPPGNGKTSIIRWLGAALPEIPIFLLRPDDGFDTDDLRTVMKRWTEEAPAILVMEDLEAAIEKVNKSTFLNLIDGADSAIGSGGLMLIGTTNHPELLDNALSNRPGRFDVVVRVGLPDDALRRSYLEQKLRDATPSTLAQLVERTNGLSFSHLEEVLRISGLIALYEGRTARTAADLLKAVDSVSSTSEEAHKGFREPPEVPFGLGALRSAIRAASKRSDGGRSD